MATQRHGATIFLDRHSSRGEIMHLKWFGQLKQVDGIRVERRGHPANRCAGRGIGSGEPGAGGTSVQAATHNGRRFTFMDVSRLGVILGR
jgi:hypothetical protein